MSLEKRLRPFPCSLPEEVLEELKKMSEETGAPVAELIRRAVLDYIQKKKVDNG